MWLKRENFGKKRIQQKLFSSKGLLSSYRGFWNHALGFTFKWNKYLFGNYINRYY